jgi:hypothetical protein
MNNNRVAYNLILGFGIIMLLFYFQSCKSSGELKEIKTETTVEKSGEKISMPTMELSVGPDIVVQDAELKDFSEFMVWVTTRKMDTIGNCKLKNINRIKGIDTLPHFFVKFQTIPIVYKMKIQNRELVFATLNTGTN